MRLNQTKGSVDAEAHDQEFGASTKTEEFCERDSADPSSISVPKQHLRVAFVVIENDPIGVVAQYCGVAANHVADETVRKLIKSFPSTKGF
jgi:hypothetical protein